MIELLEHNVETYQKLCEEMEKHNKVALVQATGTGKSYIIGKYIEEHCKNALILVPANAIGEQWSKLLPDTKIATYQAMAKGIDGDYDLIVADEMHHLGSDVWGKKFIEYFMRNPEQRVIGATATEIRYLDNSRDMVDEIFNGVAVRGIDLATAIEKGVLPTFKYVVSWYGSEKDFDEYREKIKAIKDMEKQKNLSRRLEMCIQNQVSIKEAMYENLSMSNHKIIVFLNGLCEINSALEMFKEIFPNCDCNAVSHNKSNKLNSDSVVKFQNSDRQISILFAVDMLNEGVHIEGVDSVVMFRNTVSPQIYFQQLGRGLSSTGNVAPTIFDFACNSNNIKANMIINDTSCIDIIEKTNKKIGDKKKKIIVKSYEKSIQDVFSDIQKLIGSSFLTNDEKKFIEKNFKQMTVPEMSKQLGRKEVTIYAYLRRNKMECKKTVLFMTEDEKEKIINMKMNGMSNKEICRNIGRSEAIVGKILRENEMTRKKHQKMWEKWEDDFLLSNKDMKLHELADILGRTTASIQGRKKQLHITKRRNYVPHEKILEMHDSGLGENEISIQTGYAIRTIQNILVRNGIKGVWNTNKMVAQIDNETGEVVQIYSSAVEAAKLNNFKSPGKINSCARGENKTSYGFKWKYIENQEEVESV